MFGFMVGTLCLFGLVGVVRGRRCHDRGMYRGYGGYSPGGGSSRGRSRRRRRGNAARVAGEVLKRKLDIDEDQEGIVDHAVRDVQEALTELGATLRDSRGELADAFRGDTVDEARLAATFERHDEELARARRQVVSAFKQIHAVLDDDQRAAAADWLGTADGWV
ncbi:MAG: putative membrane protein [Myxococcota bacterium]|jgi:uncharacterized membrane protein